MVLKIMNCKIKTRLKYILIIIICFSLTSKIEGIPQDYQKGQRPAKKITGKEGLTKTIETLLKTRNIKRFSIGETDMPVEDLFGIDIPKIFDCDSVIREYLDNAEGFAYYGSLSYEMEDKIRSEIEKDSLDMSVSVSSDSTADGMYFNYDLYGTKPVKIPIILKASDNSFSTTFDTTCLVKFEANIDLFLNSKKILSGPTGKGIGIRINKYSFELTSQPSFEEENNEENNEVEDADTAFVYEWRKNKILFSVGNDTLEAVPEKVSIYVISNWYLSASKSANSINTEEEADILTYEQLKKGKFKWEVSNYGSINTELILIPLIDKGDSISVIEKENTFNYKSDDLFSANDKDEISLCCNYSLKEGVNLKHKKKVTDR
jgi:hypothetical protein